MHFFCINYIFWRFFDFFLFLMAKIQNAYLFFFAVIIASISKVNDYRKIAQEFPRKLKSSMNRICSKGPKIITSNFILRTFLVMNSLRLGSTRYSKNSETMDSAGSDGGLKLFIGGLDYNTSTDGLKHFYEQWGDVIDTVIVKDPQTQQSRGFGFVTYASRYMLDNALQALPHIIDGRSVQSKLAVPRKRNDRPTQDDAGSTHIIYMTGLKRPVDEPTLKDYFQHYGGTIRKCNVVMDKETGEPRGFGFLEFSRGEEWIVDRICEVGVHDVDGHSIAVKRAINKNGQDGGNRNGGGGGGFQRSSYGDRKPRYDDRGSYGSKDNMGGGYKQDYRGGAMRSSSNQSRSKPYGKYIV